MINGIFLDPRTWTIDYLTSPFFKPDKYGVHIDLHNDAFLIPEIGIEKKYQFAITTEVWEIPMQKTLYYLRDKGLQVFFAPREIAPTSASRGLMFGEKRFMYKNNYYFKPDIIFSPSKKYANLWPDTIPIKIIGTPRFDVCLDKNRWKSKEEIFKRHGIEKNKKIIFFPSYPPIQAQTINGQNKFFDLYKDLQNTLLVLEKYAMSHNDVQVIVKIHPYAQKCYNKKIGKGNEVSGLLEKYYKNPTKYMKVIGDIRTDSSVAREMIMMADLVVGSASMMLLEAILLNVPVIRLKLEQYSSLSNMLDFDKEIITCFDKDEISSHIDGALKNKSTYIIKNSKLIEDYLYKVDGKFCERLCNEIVRAIV